MRLQSVLLCAAVLVAVDAAAQDEPPPPDYHRVDEVEVQLKRLAADYADTARLTQYGESAGGRGLWVLRVAAAGPVDPDARPAVFVGANAAGFHCLGTEAALHLLEALLKEPPPEVTFYVAPILNPDAHDAMFAAVRQRREGNDQPVDRDRDGDVGEDGPDDLNGDGRITHMRIEDPTGSWLADPEEPRLLLRADPLKSQRGRYRLETEGKDDDGDGVFNEDGTQGVFVDRSFAHAWPYPAPHAGPWPSYAPEAKAVMDLLLARRNVALAIVYGPANNLLALPEGTGRAATASQVEVPARFAGMLGLEGGKRYPLDEVWERAKDLSFVKRNEITKERFAQMLGGGPATRVSGADTKVLEELAKGYKERLEAGGLDDERPGAQYRGGGFTPWLYYQYGVMAIELDVWGVPKAKPAPGAPGDGLTIEELGKLDKDGFLALDEARLEALLKSLKLPKFVTVERLRKRVESGQRTPAQLAEGLTKLKGSAGGGDTDEEQKRRRDVLAYLDEHRPDAFAAWSKVTLPDGTEAEVGGLDPFAELTPPAAELGPALEVHTRTVLDLAGRLARLDVLEVEVEALGSGVFRVEVTGGNLGFLPTHTAMAVRARTHVPIRLELDLPEGVSLVTGQRWRSSERLSGSTGTIKGEWLVRGPNGARLTARLTSQNAGGVDRDVILEATK